jgi:hypothetical protein
LNEALGGAEGARSQTAEVSQRQANQALEFLFVILNVDTTLCCLAVAYIIGN